MPTNHFRINPSELEGLAAELERVHQLECLPTVRALGQIDMALSASWTGQARQTFSQQFGQWATHFEHIGTDLPRVAHFLRAVATEYRRLDGHRSRDLDHLQAGSSTPYDGGSASDLPPRAAGDGSWSDSPIFADTTTPDGPGTVYKTRVLTEAGAQRIFDKLYGYTWDPNDPNAHFSWDYTPDGCWARAQVMSDLIRSTYAFAPYQVWAYGQLKPDTTYAGAPVEWRYHVAPVVRVRDAQDNLVDMVIDPSLADQPVPVADWLRLMQADVATTQVTVTSPNQPLESFPANWSEDFRDAYSREVMENLNQCVQEGIQIESLVLNGSIEPDTCALPDPALVQP